MIKTAAREDLAGLLQWQLWDLKPGVSAGGGLETHEDYFGLLKRDGTWKPAMALFRDGWPGPSSSAPAGPLPSLTKSNLPLTAQSKPAPPSDPLYVPPLYFPETGSKLHLALDDVRVPDS